MTTKTMTVSAARGVGLGQWGRMAVGGAVLGVAVVVASLTPHAQAQEPMGGGRSGPAMFGGPPEHMARHLDRMLDGLGVSDAQRGQIRRIAMAAAADLKAQRDAGRGLQDRGVQIFTAPAIDASAAEALRQEMLAQHDQSSKRVLQAMLDIGQVLTPEQRAKIGIRMKERQAVMQDRMQRMAHDHPHDGGPAHPKP